MNAPHEPRPGESWCHRRLPSSPATVTRVGHELHTGKRILTLRWSNGREETVYMASFLRCWTLADHPDEVPRG